LAPIAYGYRVVSPMLIFAALDFASTEHGVVTTFWSTAEDVAEDVVFELLGRGWCQW
jgi:hypothetical protein